MGVFGWNLLKDNVTVVGTVDNHYYASDGDWNINVRPQSAYKSLLTNSDGDKNVNGLIECEVEPISPYDDEGPEKAYCGFLQDKVVTIVGSWSEDLSHDDKTEIHPITSILCEQSKAGADTKRIQFFTFSDDSELVHPPFSGESRTGKFKVPFPAPREDGLPAKHTVLSEVFKAASRKFNVTHEANRDFLVGEVVSGKPDDDKGFYHALIELSYGQPSGRMFAGAFRSGTDGHGLWIAEWPGFEAKWQEWSKAGLRLVELTTYVDGGKRLFAGVFRAGTDGHGLWISDWASFQAKWQEWSKAGLRLVDLTTYVDGGQRMFAGVFRAGTDGHGLWISEWASFQAKWQEWSKAGLRLINLTTYLDGGQRMFAGVFRAGTDGHGLWISDWASFQAKWQEWSKAGLRLVSLFAYPQ